MSRYDPPNCPDIYPWFPDEDPPLSDAWTCIPGVAQGGQSNYQGCDIGCKPCVQDDAASFEPNVGVSTSGYRWLRPDDQAESRDAYGQYVFFPSENPVRLPYPKSTHQIAMVWAIADWAGIGGGEYWWTAGQPMSICYSHLHDCGDTLPCPYVPVFEKRPTCWWYTGYQYEFGNGANTITCTGNYLGAGPESVPFVVGTLGQAAFVTTMKSAGGGAHNASPGGCTPNFLALCLGKELTVSEVCNPHWDPNPDQYFVSTHGIWDYLYIKQVAAQFHRDESSPDQDPAAIAAKNAALTWLNGHLGTPGTGLEKIDFAGNHNSSLDFWSRGWNDSASQYPTLDDVPYIVATWPNCRLRYSGHPVIVDWIPWHIAIRASIVLVRIDTRQVCDPYEPNFIKRSKLHNAYYPLVKLEIVMRMAARASFADPDGEHQLIRTWLPADDPDRIVDLEITNRETERHPAITAPEKLIYVDAGGREFDGLPPLTVHWKGSLEPLTRHGWGDHFPHHYYESLGSSAAQMLCCAVAEGMRNVTVHAEASHPDAQLDRLYTDDVRIGVDPQYGGCPEP